MRESVLIVGAGGLLGGALMAHGNALGEPVHGTWRRADPTALTAAPPSPSGRVNGSGTSWLDLTEVPEAWGPPAGCQAAIVCGAVTRLEACRRDPAGTRWINVVQTLKLMRRLREAGVFVVFPSSNLVFDGEKPRLAAEAPVRPQTEYGRQKAEVEAELRDWGGDGAAVVRLTKVVHGGWPLLTGWREALRRGEVIRPFEDLGCAPIALDGVVTGLWRIARERRAGIWQFSAPDEVTYAAVGRHFARWLGVSEERVQPMAAGGDAGRGPGVGVVLEHQPRHTTLDTTRAEEELGMEFPPGLEAMERVWAGRWGSDVDSGKAEQR